MHIYYSRPLQIDFRVGKSRVDQAAVFFRYHIRIYNFRSRGVHIKYNTDTRTDSNQDVWNLPECPCRAASRSRLTKESRLKNTRIVIWSLARRLIILLILLIRLRERGQTVTSVQI